MQLNQHELELKAPSPALCLSSTNRNGATLRPPHASNSRQPLSPQELSRQASHLECDTVADATCSDPAETGWKLASRSIAFNPSEDSENGVAGCCSAADVGLGARACSRAFWESTHHPAAETRNRSDGTPRTSRGFAQPSWDARRRATAECSVDVFQTCWPDCPSNKSFCPI